MSEQPLEVRHALAMERLSAQMQSHGEKLDRIIENQQQHQTEIYGAEGNNGLRTQVRLLMESEERRHKREFRLWSVSLGALASGLMGLITWLAGGR